MILEIITLLGRQYKIIAYIGIKAAKTDGAVAIILKRAMLEYVIIIAIVGATALGRIDADQVAKAVDETSGAREYGAAGQRPFCNEGFDFIIICH